MRNLAVVSSDDFQYNQDESDFLKYLAAKKKLEKEVRG